jgi:hypothetical protein
MGKVGAAPSSAIELNETNDSVPNQNLHFSDVYIGGFSGETGEGTQFTRGIEWTGTSNNNAEILFTNTYVTGCSGAAIYQNSTQNVNLTLEHFVSYFNGVGLHICGAVCGKSVVCLGNTIDIETPFADDFSANANPHIKITGFYSEASGRMLESSGGAIVAIQGKFQITSSLNADGKIIKQEGNNGYHLKLTDFEFTQASAPSASPFLSLRSSVAGAAKRMIILDGMISWGWLGGGTNGLNVATRGATDQTYIYFRENSQVASATPLKVAQNWVIGNGVDWDWDRFDVPDLNVMSGGSTTISTGVGSVKMSTTNAANNAAWIPIQYAGVTYYVPAWTTNSP